MSTGSRRRLLNQQLTTISDELLKTICDMSDDDLDKCIEFHKWHLEHLYIQKKVRREELEVGSVDMVCVKDKSRTCPDDETCCQGAQACL